MRSAGQTIEERVKEDLRVEQARLLRIVHEGTVVLERPRYAVSLFDERMRVVLVRHARSTRPTQMAHRDQRLSRRALDVQLRNLPGGSVVPRCVRRTTRIPHVHLRCTILETGEAPAVFVPAFVRCPDRAHALRREVRELLEQVVVHGSWLTTSIIRQKCCGGGAAGLPPPPRRGRGEAALFLLMILLPVVYVYWDATPSTVSRYLSACEGGGLRKSSRASVPDVW